MARAITELCQLSDSARSLSLAGNEYPARILGNLAGEEASKVLILMDAIRCPPERGVERSRLLRYFYMHLPKGIYMEVCGWGGVLTFAELMGYIEIKLNAYYLDGPNDVDWIFRNQIIQRREDDLYVNYVREDGGEGQRYWTSPSKEAANSLLPYHRSTPMVISIARALHEAGAASPAGLAVVAEIWRPITMTPELRVDELRKLNRSTLTTLETRDLLRQVEDDVFQTVIQHWPFPLYDVDLNERKVERNELRGIQQDWTPGY